jgi:hypothetical protein
MHLERPSRRISVRPLLLEDGTLAGINFEAINGPSHWIVTLLTNTWFSGPDTPSNANRPGTLIGVER